MAAFLSVALVCSWFLSLEECALVFARSVQAEVLIGPWRGDTALGRSFEEAELNQVGFVHFFNSLSLLSNRYGQR